MNPLFFHEIPPWISKTWRVPAQLRAEVQQSLLAQGHLGGNATDASRACLAQIRATSQAHGVPPTASVVMDDLVT